MNHYTIAGLAFVALSLLLTGLGAHRPALTSSLFGVVFCVIGLIAAVVA